MELNRPWTPFALDAEVEAYGTARLCEAHNALRLKVQALRELLEQAIARIDLANAEGDMILSAWIGEARQAVAALD